MDERTRQIIMTAIARIEAELAGLRRSLGPGSRDPDWNRLGLSGPDDAESRN